MCLFVFVRDWPARERERERALVAANRGELPVSLRAASEEPFGKPERGQLN